MIQSEYCWTLSTTVSWALDILVIVIVGYDTFFSPMNQLSFCWHMAVGTWVPCMLSVHTPVFPHNTLFWDGFGFTMVYL